MTESSLKLIPVREGDHSVWLPLWNAYLEFYETKLDETIQATTWARLLDPSEPVDGIIAWRDDQPIGLVHFIRHRSAWTVGDYCYLQDLFVDQSARGMGVGRSLIEAVYADARAKGCSRVHWLTHETNADAMLLYDRIGTRSGFVQYRNIFSD